MNITTPILTGAAHLAALPGDSAASLLRMIGEGFGLFDDGPDGGLGMAMSGLAGVAAALAVAIVLTLYFRSGYRTRRDVVKHGLAMLAVLGLVAFVAYDMRQAALAYLGINPAKPAVEFEIRLPKAALSAISDTQVELHTNRNQRLAQMSGALDSDDGRSVLRGSVTQHHRSRRDPEPAGPGAMRVQAAVGGQPHPLQPVRTVAPCRPHRFPHDRRGCGDPIA
jgi:hypothetical protein